MLAISLTKIGRVNIHGGSTLTTGVERSVVGAQSNAVGTVNVLVGIRMERQRGYEWLDLFRLCGERNSFDFQRWLCLYESSMAGRMRVEAVPMLRCRIVDLNGIWMEIS